MFFFQDTNKYGSYPKDCNRTDLSSRDSREKRVRSHRSNRPSRFSSVDERRSEEGDRKSNVSSEHPSGENVSETRRTFNKQFFRPPEEGVIEQLLENFDDDPNCPSWQLPASIMFNLIALKDFDFVPLDEKKLCLIRPTVPSEDLLIAIENFYMPPAPERIRDGEGWERLDLSEFYAKKDEARLYYDKIKVI